MVDQGKSNDEIVDEKNETATESEETNESEQSTEQIEPEVSTTDPKTWENNANNAEDADKEKFARLKHFAHAYWAKKKWTIPLTVLLLIVLILAIPISRYKILGLFLKQNYVVSVIDASTNKPVSGAAVTLADKVVSTDAAGKANLHVPVGPQKLAVSKKYYKIADSDVTVPIGSSTKIFQIRLVATGRQVPITVINKITGKGLSNVAIAVLGTDTKTDKNGKAVIVLPTTAFTQKASLRLNGYNTGSVTIQVTDQVIKANDFAMTASGKLYFLSNQSGKIDVVKTDLDGTNRQTVLAGTGGEDQYTTSLLASRDWKYLALLAKRDNGQQGIYLIDTTNNDKVTNIDGGSSTASFTLIGWSNSTFMYQVNRSNITNWQSGAQSIKGYDAAAGKLYNIDQTQGEGTGTYDYGFTNFTSVYILNDQLVYAKNWYSSTYPNHLSGKSVSLVSVKPDGSGKKTIQDFPIPASNQYYYVNLAPYEPQGVYVSVPAADNGSGSGANTYYEYEDGQLSQKSSVTDDIFNKTYPTFLVSPSGKSTFWSDVRDNKNTLFTGDDAAQNQKQIASLSDYVPYGWYSDDYLLVSKNGSELYIMGSDGKTAALKVSDYYKPQLTYRGYGGGYGGL